MNQKNRYRLIAPLLPFLILGACSTPKAFYSSPFNGNNGDYQTIPLVADSVKSATYGSIALWSGSANTHGKDHFNAVHLSLSRSHDLGVIQGWYGANITWGGFTMGQWDASNANGNQPVQNIQYLNQLVGTKYFGGYGFSGGMNGVKTFDGGEWRFIGFETSLTQEFGDYITVRQQMPDSIAALDVKSAFFGTLGVTTELVRKNNTGQFGWKWAAGWALGNHYQSLNIDDNGTHIGGYGYFNFTFHWTYLRYTGFMQLNTATKASTFHLGFNIQL